MPMRGHPGMVAAPDQSVPKGTESGQPYHAIFSPPGEAHSGADSAGIALHAVQFITRKLAEIRHFLRGRWEERKFRQKGLAERQGFEPWMSFWPILTFQASAFDHSATAPHALEGERPSGMRGVPQAGYS